MSTTVAWVSRHPPLEGEIERLRDMIGEFDIVQLRDTFKDARQVLEQVKEAGADISVVVLPLSMVAQYLPLAQKEGIEVWYAKMKPMREVGLMPPDFNPKTDVLLPDLATGKSRWLRFDSFQRIKEVRVVLEPIKERELEKYRDMDMGIGL